MAKVAERLIILREHNDALLQRLYNIRKTLTDQNLKPQIFKDPNVTKKLFAQLLKDAPFSGDNIESVRIILILYLYNRYKATNCLEAI
jgi:hypothetical protein